MELKELQARVKEFNEKRGWDYVLPSQVISQFLEQLGAVTNHVLFFEGYKDPSLAYKRNHRSVGERLADCLYFTLKLANMFDVDLEEVFGPMLDEDKSRFPADRASQSMDAYYARQRQLLGDLEAGFRSSRQTGT